MYPGKVAKEEQENKPAEKTACVKARGCDRAGRVGGTERWSI